jgi:type II secretory pathway predicted ATPase ExeA/nucleoid-associated protein YgaU
MYLSHFHLSDEPFAITSDPRFLWLSPHHEEAFAHLLYAIQQRKGFAVLTGDIGTGKTTLINSALDRLGDTVRTAVIYNASLDTDELLHYIFHDFGMAARKRSRSEAVIELNDWLIEQAEADINTVIVVDEAQNLSSRTLEDLRLLSNMETARRKLLQILLVGQPELNEKLARPELAQLQQRIAIRYHLRPFQGSETREYVRHRFRIVGGDPSLVFSTDALDLLHSAAHGVPRVINQICDTALLKAYSHGRTQIDGEFLQAVLREDFAHRPAQPGSMNKPRIDDGHAQNDPPGPQRPTRGLKLRRRATWLWVSLGLVAVVLLFQFGIRERSQMRVSSESHAADQQIRETQTELARLRAELALRDSLVLAATIQADSITRALTQSRSTPTATSLVATTEPVLLADREGWVKVRIRRDDTLTKIVKQVYGRDDWQLVEAVVAANSFIKNPNTIRIGDELLLPPAGE